MALSVGKFGALIPQVIGFLMGDDLPPIRVLDKEGKKALFTTALFTDLEIKENKKATRFTVESGAERSDHVIDQLIEMDLTVELRGKESAEVFEDLRSAFLKRQLFTIQSRMDTFPNMLIEAFPHNYNRENYEGATLKLKLVEWREIQTEYGEVKTKNTKLSSTVERGVQKGVESQGRGSSILHGWFN